jgi:thiamine biosynthesis lipoprotein ApbE
MGSSTTVAVADGRALGPAVAVTTALLGAVEAACSRFIPTSELSLLNDSAGSEARVVSPILSDAIGAALDAAAATGGLVDPTMGRLIERLGYTVTFADLPLDGPPIAVERRECAGWRTVVFDPASRTVRLPAGVALDLGAIGKAWAADRCAAAAARCTGCGVLVACGGDVAVAGPPPAEGWCVRVAERPAAQPWQDVLAFDGGVATSGTGSRRWRRGQRVLHHILDPATGIPAESPWRTVTVAAASCAEANAAATASIILGDSALGWLDGLDLPARLVDSAGRTVMVGGWPAAS